MLDYPALAALAAVIRDGSFERAAATLGVTPSAVSQRVRALEERVGAVLVVRGQPCRPTALGQRLCAHVDRVALLEADLAPALGTADGAASTPLRIAVNADSLATWFPQAVAGFAATSDMRLDLTLDDELHTAERLRSGEVLAAVTADPEPVQGCRTLALGSLRYVACASPPFMERYFPSGVDAMSLASAPYLRFDRRDHLQARWVGEAYGVELEAAPHWVPSTQAFLDLALAGVGWGLQPLSLAAPALAAGRLVLVGSAHAVAVTLHWTVARLEIQALRLLTQAVRRAAGDQLQR